MLFHKEAEKDRIWRKRHLWFRNLEMNDAEAVQLWERFRSLSLAEFKRLYNFLGIHFDSYQGESFYNNLLEETVKKLVDKGWLKKARVPWIVDLEPYGCLLACCAKRDGATLYITRDLAAAIYRYEQYRFHKLLYVVGSEQNLHFKQLFKILELMGYHWAQNCVHIPFGLIHFKEGRMSTCRGE